MQRLYLGGVLSGIPSLFLAVIALLLAINTPQPVTPNVINIINDYNQAAFFSNNFLTYTLTGVGEDVAGLSKMITIHNPSQIVLNTEPNSASAYNIYDIAVKPNPSDGTRWVIKTGVTITPPGGATKRLYYLTRLLQFNGAFQAQDYPQFITDSSVNVSTDARDAITGTRSQSENSTPGPLTISTIYGSSVSQNSPISQTVNQFITAFYTPESSDHSIGRYVSGNFKDKPITAENNIYQKMVVIDLRQANDEPPLGDTSTRDITVGKTYHVDATVRAEVSTTTYTYLAVPLNMVYTKDHMWVVDQLSTWYPLLPMKHVKR